METNSSSYTILRIKRKRDEEVPGVLGKFGSTRNGFRFWVLNVHTLNVQLQYIVIDSAAKKDSKRRKAGLDVFQFAETASESAWNKLHDEELRVRPITFHYSSPPPPPFYPIYVESHKLHAFNRILLLCWEVTWLIFCSHFSPII